MTIIDALKELSNYPVPYRVFNKAAIKGGIDLNDEYTINTETEQGYIKAVTHIYRWLSEAPVPNLSELGIGFSWTEDNKKSFKIKADRLENIKSPFGIINQ